MSLELEGFSICELCQYLHINRSSFYHNKSHIENHKYDDIESLILELFYKHKCRYGYRRILILLHKLGIKINHKTVQKLMKSLGLRGKVGKNRKYNSYKGTVGKVAPNIINRDFRADTPFEKLYTDVTEFKINDNEKIYFSPVLDGFSNEIVAYSISGNGDLQLVHNMLKNLYKVLPEDSTKRSILHSDQGFQYQHQSIVNSLIEHGITQSMSRKATCLDNALMEGTFGKIKVEFFHKAKFNNKDDFIKQLEEYIHYYNNERIITALNMSPVEYRKQFSAA